MAAEIWSSGIRLMYCDGIRDPPASPRSPWQNGYAERLISSIRRECLDHIVVFGERHLRHMLLSYMKYHNEVRTHLSLEKDALSRSVELAGRNSLSPSSGRVTSPICPDLIYDRHRRPLLSVPYHRIFCTAQDRFCGRAAPAALPRDSQCHCMPDIYAQSASWRAFSFECLRPHQWQPL